MSAMKVLSSQIPSKVQPSSVKARSVLKVACVARPSTHNQSSKPKSPQSLQLNSTLLPLIPVIAAARVNPIESLLKPQAEYFATLGLPEWLIHWGHPGNMAVVLFAMGFYGSGYLGWQIKNGKDIKVKQYAIENHPKIALGMFFFFGAGALGGVTSLLMQGKPIFSSPHATTGLIGLTLLGFQAMLPLFFKDDPNARGLHAGLGASILALFTVHAALGLQLGLSI